MQQSKYWCFTVNNPPGLLDPSLMDGVTYCVYSEEVGDSGTYHLQGYVEFRTKRRLNAVREVLGGTAHVEPRRGTQEEAILYATKVGILGSLPRALRGARSTILLMLVDRTSTV